MRIEQFSCARQFARGHILSLGICVVLLAGCQTLHIPSARILSGRLAANSRPIESRPPDALPAPTAAPTQAVPETADPPVRTDLDDTEPTDSAPPAASRRTIEQPAASAANSGPAAQEIESLDTDLSPDPASDDAAACTEPGPRPIRRLAMKIQSCTLRCKLGPLFNHRAPYDPEALAEAELQPPFARFHPVPTAPVFAPRYDYDPPQLMMAPVPQPNRLPQLLSPRSATSQPEPRWQGDTIEPTDTPLETIPVPESALGTSAPVPPPPAAVRN